MGHKTITVAILILALVCGIAMADDTAGKINKRVQDHFGVNMTARIKDGTYKETEVKEYRRKVAREEIAKGTSATAAAMTPAQIKLTLIEITPAWDISRIAEIFSSVSTADLGAAIKGMSIGQRTALRASLLKPETITAIALSGGKMAEGYLTAVNALQGNRIPVVGVSNAGESLATVATDLREALTEGRYSDATAALKAQGIDVTFTDTMVMAAIPRAEPFFVDAVYGENSYNIGTRERALAGDVVVVDVSSTENRLSFAKFLQYNKGTRYAVQLGYEALNNNEITDKARYPAMLAGFKDFFLLAKGIDPAVVVGVTVCFGRTHRAWIEALPFRPDVLFVWNVYKMSAPFRKIAQQFRGAPIVIAGMNVASTEGAVPNPAGYMRALRDAGITGSIWYK